MKLTEKLMHNPLVHISKRNDTPKWEAWLIRGAALVVALIVCGIVSMILTEGSFGEFFSYLFNGVFGTPRRIWNMLYGVAILLVIALAVTPAFKMRFWNIGAEGQVLVGALLCATCMFYFGGKIDDSLLILIMFVVSVVAGALWAVIPAIFKAKWNTNETLFTLMMNYIAACLVGYCINTWVTSGSGILGILKYGHLPVIGNQTYLLPIILVAILTVLVAIYLRFSKHGYELTVVGESMNTAKYIGINTKKVIVRTMLLSGAICGIAGFLLVGGVNHTVNKNLVDGRGFTAILVSWLAKFNPLAMVLTSFLVVFIDQGASQVATMYSLGGAFPDIITGIFFFFIIACEFLISYKVKFNIKRGAKKSSITDDISATAEQSQDGIIADNAQADVDTQENDLDNVAADINEDTPPIPDTANTNGR